MATWIDAGWPFLVGQVKQYPYLPLPGKSSELNRP
jgi:hypothetical protein